MYVDSWGNTGVTTDPQKVRPGMIFVDLSGRRNRRQIYEAYVNGASLILTTHNISDPELPVVKVRNPQDTALMLLNGLLGANVQKSKLVGLLGAGDKSMLMELVQGILAGTASQESLKGIPISIDTNAWDLFYLGNVGLDSVIITDGGYIENTGGNRPPADYLYSLLNGRTVILNNDDQGAAGLLNKCSGAAAITYGLNKKAAVTASSIDICMNICFNYCVQKSFISRKGQRIEPFEMPVKLNALGSHNIYDALAAITCGLYYDVDINTIKSSIESYKVPSRHFQILHDDGFTIIDNYCNSIHDYTAAFESMQSLNYENLILIVSISHKTNLDFHLEKACLIAEWARMLKCREVILTSCMDGDARIGELPLKRMRVYRKVFKENGISFKYYHLLQHAIDRGLSGLKKGDMLVMLGSDEMNMAQKLLHRQLKPLGIEKH
jgi:UDP-N-acetylmuramoyl-L-alanyl-D-glutamate--2,6-diaminopimelate ligase